MPRDYPEYEDESPEETYRDPLKPFLIALVVLLLLFAAIIVLLYMRASADREHPRRNALTGADGRAGAA